MDPASDTAPFFSDFKEAKKIFFITYPQIHYLQSLKFNFLLKFCIKILFCKHYFSPLNTFMRKGKEPEPEPDPDPVSDPDPQHWEPDHFKNK